MVRPAEVINPLLDINGGKVSRASCGDFALSFYWRKGLEVGVNTTALGFMAWVWGAGKHQHILDKLAAEGFNWRLWDVSRGLPDKLLETIFTKGFVAKLNVARAKDNEPWAPKKGGSEDAELQAAIGTASPVRGAQRGTGFTVAELFPRDQSKSPFTDSGFRQWLLNVMRDLPYEVALAYYIFDPPMHFAVKGQRRETCKTAAYVIGSAWLCDSANVMIDSRLKGYKVSQAAAVRARVNLAISSATGAYHQEAKWEKAWTDAARGRNKAVPADVNVVRKLYDWGAYEGPAEWLRSKGRIVGSGLGHCVAQLPRTNFPKESMLVTHNFALVVNALKTSKVTIHMVPLIHQVGAFKTAQAVGQGTKLFWDGQCFNEPQLYLRWAPDHKGRICFKSAEMINWQALATALNNGATDVWLYGSTPAAAAAAAKRLNGGGGTWIRMLTHGLLVFKARVLVHDDCLTGPYMNVAAAGAATAMKQADAEYQEYKRGHHLTEQTLKTMRCPVAEPAGVPPFIGVLEVLSEAIKRQRKRKQGPRPAEGGGAKRPR